MFNKWGTAAGRRRCVLQTMTFEAAHRGLQLVRRRQQPDEAWRAVLANPHKHTSHGSHHKPHPLASGSLGSVYLCVNPFLPPFSCMLSLAPPLSSLKASRLLFHPGCCYRISWNTFRWRFGLLTVCGAASTEGCLCRAEPSLSGLSFPFPSCDCKLSICLSPPHPPSPD